MSKFKILILVNGRERGYFGIRARGLVKYFDNIEYKILYRKRKLYSLFRFLIYSLAYKSSLIYVINISYSGIIAALLAKFLSGKKLIIETGDINYELFKTIGRAPLICLLERALEYLSLMSSDVIITRGKYFKEYLENKGCKNVYYIPDGVDVSKFRPMQMSGLKKRIAPNNELVIGIVGSLTWSKQLNLCYGWDLIEMLNIMKDKPIKGVIIGDGNGRKNLEQKVKKHGIDNKIIFTGWLAYEKLPEYINIMDICLSTQTNDVVGWMRTTGKLPLYLACGKYILATDVGGAHYILPPNMRLQYNGKKDSGYPQRLVRAINEILANRELLKQGAKNRDIALENFDYKKLSKRLETILEDTQNA